MHISVLLLVRCIPSDVTVCLNVAYLEDVNKMYGGRPDQQQQWTVHAEFTIKHDGMEDPSALPKTHTERDENGVRMVYSWTSQPPATSTTNTNDSHSFRTDRSTTSSGSDVKDPQLPYGFQRGNLVFTSTPPKRHPFSNIDAPSKGQDSSGYGSELLSPNSGGFPYRPIQPYNRRCRSTCSIVLSADFDQKAEDNPDNPQCGRTHSLRCQTPTAKSEKKDYYGCGDPWCYHACGEDYCRFPPLQEIDEYDSTSSKRPSRASTFMVRQSDRSKSSPSKAATDSKKDACVQTYEMIDKCTSPFLRTDSFERKTSNSGSGDVKLRRERNIKKKINLYESRRKTEPIHQRHSPSSFTPDSLDSQQVARVFSRFVRVNFTTKALVLYLESCWVIFFYFFLNFL